MLHNLFFKTLWDYRYAILGWSIGFIGLSFYLMYFYPYISKSTAIFEALEHMPPIIKNLIGENIKLRTPAGFFSIQPFSMMAPLLFLIFGITKGGDAIAGEKERGTLDLLLTNPISRSRLIFEKTAAIAVSMLFLAFIFWLGMTLSSILLGVTLSSIRLAEILLSCFSLGFLFSVFTLFLSSLWQKKKLVIGMVTGYAIVAYLINAYAPMVEVLQSFRIFSPFYYYNGTQPLINGLNFSHFFILIFLIFLFFICSIISFRRADLS